MSMFFARASKPTISLRVFLLVNVVLEARDDNYTICIIMALFTNKRKCNYNVEKKDAARLT